MAFELTVFVILTILTIVSGIGAVFHYKSKKPITDNERTAYGLISLTLGAWATVTLLIMGGLI